MAYQSPAEEDMASSNDPTSGQAWRDELQSFLPHALDCVDPNCLRPLCVNLKLTLRHVQVCEKVDKCAICQGMKSLAATHSNSCRDYYCRVPFCMEAKVTTQQQILMDELVKTFDEGFNSSNKDDSPQMKVECQERRKEDVPRTQVSDRPVVPNAIPKAVDQEMLLSAEGCPEQIPSSVADKIWPERQCPVVPVTKHATPKPVDKEVLLSREKCLEETPASDTFWPTTQFSQNSCEIATQVPAVPVESLQPQWMESPKLPKYSQSTAQGQLTMTMVNSETSSPPQWYEQMPSTPATAADLASSHSQAGTKRKVESSFSNDESTPPSKIRRPAVSKLSSQKQYRPEVEIVESKSFRRLSREVSGGAVSSDSKIHQKRKPSNNEFLPKMPSTHMSIKQSKQASTTLLSSLPVHYTERNSSLKTSTPKPLFRGFQVTKNPAKVCRGASNSSKATFRPVFQDNDQIADDSADCYIDEMFSTPPPSPTFEMWLGETVKTNGSTAMKTVLLETLFQLLGVITQPKTEQQEAVFVDLLEKTLRVMKTEIAK